MKIDGRRQMNLVNKLSPFASYQFRIAAYNENGLGEYSEPSPSYNTRPDKPTREEAIQWILLGPKIGP